jgi:hypothetical protein
MEQRFSAANKGKKNSALAAEGNIQKPGAKAPQDF